MAKYTKKEQEIIDKVFSGISLVEEGLIKRHDIVDQNYIYDFALTGDKLTILIPMYIHDGFHPNAKIKFDTANVIKEVKKRALNSGLGIKSVEVVRADSPAFDAGRHLVRRRIIMEGYTENPEDLPKLASL